MLQPSLEIITNIDGDHLVNYEGSMSNLEQSFIEFIKKLPFNGLLVACGDDPIIKQLLGFFPRKTILYGFEEHNDYRIDDYKTKFFSSEFSLSNKQGSVSKFELNLPGKHNVLNAAAASVLAIEEGVSLINIKTALKKFSGINRRMELLGKLNEITVIDDYGHHPTEIKNTLITLKECLPEEEITMIFQPHRYTRTKDLFNQFIDVLSKVERLILLEVYSAGEKAIKGINSQSILEAIKNKGKKKLFFASSIEHAIELTETFIPNEKGILLIQGAGSISKISQELLEKIGKQ